MSKNTTRRSILKNTLDATESTRNVSQKRLSFVGVDDANESNSEGESMYKRIFLASNLKYTAIGACYVPPETDPFLSLNSKVPTQSLSKSSRPDYRLLYKKDDSKSVLIIGGEISLCDGFQIELEKAGNVLQADNLKCTSVVQPNFEDIHGADFFIFLFQLDKCYSISEVKSKLEEVEKHVKCFHYRSLVVNISSPSGPFNNIGPCEDHHQLLVDFQMPSITFCIIDRERKFHILKRILATINGSCEGNSVDALIRWGLSTPVESDDLVLT